MSVCQMRIGDGRDEFHERSVASLEEMLPKPDTVVVVDDRDHELGFTGAIQEGWRKARATGCEWVWHAELDFTYNAPVPLDRMIDLLERRPYLAQLALRRQPAGLEIPFGGFIEQRPRAYSECSDGDHHWLEHKRWFTTNPSLYRAQVCDLGWPSGKDSETRFAQKLREGGLPWGVAGDQVRFGFWGSMEGGRELVHHIGDVRTGHGY